MKSRGGVSMEGVQRNESSPVPLGVVDAFVVLLLPAPMARSADNQLTAGEKQAGWILLFDGKTLDGWLTSAWKPSRTPVQDGCINPHRCGDYMMIHTQQWSDCILSLDFKISKAATAASFCALTL